MSSAMASTTNGRMNLGSVRVVLPHWWNNTASIIGEITLEDPDPRFSWDTADIRLEEAPMDVDKYDDHAPHTLQVSGTAGIHYVLKVALKSKYVKLYSSPSIAARLF